MSTTTIPVGQPVGQPVPNVVYVKQPESGFCLLGKLFLAYIIFVIIVCVLIFAYAMYKHSSKSENFESMVRVTDHTGIMNRPDIIDSELNWQKKYNPDNLTADEYYDDRMYNHTGHTSAPIDFKYPGTGTLYRKFTKKSAN